jgi:hypothetical protein
MTASLESEHGCIFISYRRDDARGASGRDHSIVMTPVEWL